MFQNPTFILVNKLITLGFWVAVIFQYTVGFPAPVGPALALAGPLIFIAHIVEVGLFLARFKAGSDNPPVDAILILIFGVFHLRPIIDKCQDQ